MAAMLADGVGVRSDGLDERGRRLSGVEREVGDLARAAGPLAAWRTRTSAMSGPMAGRWSSGLQARRQAGRTRVEPHDEVPGSLSADAARRVVEGARRGADDGFVRARASASSRWRASSACSASMPSRAAMLAAGQPGVALDVGVGVAMRHAERGGQLRLRPWSCRSPSARPARCGPCGAVCHPAARAGTGSRRQTGRASSGPRQAAVPTTTGTRRSRGRGRGASTRGRMPVAAQARQIAGSAARHRGTRYPRSGRTARPTRGPRPGHRGATECRDAGQGRRVQAQARHGAANPMGT